MNAGEISSVSKPLRHKLDKHTKPDCFPFNSLRLQIFGLLSVSLNKKKKVSQPSSFSPCEVRTLLFGMRDTLLKKMRAGGCILAGPPIAFKICSHFGDEPNQYFQGVTEKALPKCLNIPFPGHKIGWDFSSLKHEKALQPAQIFQFFTMYLEAA